MTRDAQFGPKTVVEPNDDAIQRSYNSTCEEEQATLPELPLSAEDIRELRKCDLSRLDLTPAGLSYLCDMADAAIDNKAKLSAVLAAKERVESQLEILERQFRITAKDLANAGDRCIALEASLHEALSRAERAEAERDEALAEQKWAEEVADGYCSRLIAAEAEIAHLTFAPAGAREEADKLWQALFWIDRNDPELTAFAAARFGLDMEGHLGSCSEPTQAAEKNG